MALDPSFIGKVYPSTFTYVVGREKIREFATAVQATFPAYTDVAAARALGYADVIAPPTFAVIVAQQADDAFIWDPELGLDVSRIVHADERFVSFSQIVAGDELQAELHVVAVTERAGISMVTTRAEISRIVPAADGGASTFEDVCHVTSSLVVRGVG